MKKYKTHIVWAVVAAAALVGGFFYGKSMAVGAGSRSGFAAGAFSSSTRAGFAGRIGTGAGGAGGLTIGTITAMDSQSLTLQLPNGNSEVVFYSSSTSVSEPTIVSPSSLSSGTMVMVAGTQNSDGSVTAQTIQVRPAGAGGAGRGIASSTGAQGG